MYIIEIRGWVLLLFAILWLISPAITHLGARSGEWTYRKFRTWRQYRKLTPAQKNLARRVKTGNAHRPSGKMLIDHGQPSERIYFIARSRRDIDFWCNANDIDPYSVMIIWVTGYGTLNGVKNAYYVDLGTDRESIRAQVQTLVELGHLRKLEPLKLKG
jgi:hypothetical protein